MKKILIILALAVFLVSCNQQNPGIVQDFHTGTGGLEVDFMQDMPPKEVQEKTSFNIGIKLQNKGAWGINNAKIMLSGYDEDLFSVKMLEPQVDDATGYTKPPYMKHYDAINGRDFESPYGEIKYLYFEVNNKDKPLHEDYNANFVLTACYGYFTEASFSVCVDPVRSEVTKQACEVKPITSDGQGGPVAITKIEPTILFYDGQAKEQFKISIANKEKGRVTQVKAFPKECSREYPWAKLSEDELNVVEVWAYLGDKQIDCNLDTESVDEFNLKLKERGENAVICKTPVEGDVAYVSPLYIKLRYGYIIDKTKTVLVKASPKPSAEAEKPADK